MKFFYYNLSRILKNSLILISLIFLPAISSAQNFAHIKTFGYDYLNFANDPVQADWLAKRHDWIIGPQIGNLTFDGNRVTAITYNAIKNANSDTKVMVYGPYHTIFPYMSEWMENWCVENGRDIEELYYHYFTDTVVQTTQGLITVPGYGDGSATSLSEARAPAKWWGGQYPNINPTSQTFRDAFAAMSLAKSTIIGTSTYADGLYLDTFSGSAETGYWSVRLENTIEMRDLNITTEADARAKVNQDLVDAYLHLENYLKTQTNNSSFVVLANGAEPSYMYNWQSDLFETYSTELDKVAQEYLIQSLSNTSLIPDLRKTYDDLEAGRQLWIRSQTNYTNNVPYNFKRFIFASHYLVNHENAYFFYHQGSPINYGGSPIGELRETHWHKNMEVNVGTPVVRSGTDYWGENNTDRFFIFEQTSSYVILGREYTNALVLAKFGVTGGFANIGTNPTSHNLDSDYYPLLEDNSTGTATSNITLGNSEGITLMKSAGAVITPPAPINVNASFEIIP